ncbi:hypothetical protein [Cribrihabitans pelagius]|uniref:hypothetical protein n=1 Tax=Cribrihabitans pelagius TaxID=1765746 RepID=UPI003B5C62F5
MDRIEGFALGTAFLLHSQESGALLSSNAFGRDIYDALSARLDLTDISAKIARQHGVAPGDAAPLVEEVIARWQAAGLFQPGMCPFAAPVAYRVPHTGPPQIYRLGDRYVILRCEDPQLSEQIAASLRDYAAGALDMPDDGTTALIDVIAADADAEAEYGVFRDREPVWGRAPQDLTRFHVIRECMDHFCTPSRVAAHLHAAAVADSGRAVILAGGSGSGKTTLAMGLMAAGGALAADDHVALAVDGRHMLAFPAASAVKRGAWDLPEIQALGLAGGAAASPRDGVRYLRPPRCVPAATPVAVAAIVFPQYGGADAANGLARLDPARALTQLIQTGGRVSRRNPSLAPLVALLDRVPCYELRYGSTRYSVETCQSLLAR